MSPISTYLKKITKNLQLGNATEHTHRPALKTLLESLAPNIIATNEPKRVECGAPDYVVSQSAAHGLLTIGYAEAKDTNVDLVAVEKDARRAELRTANGKQLKRYWLALPNLLFTNYLDFRWYVDGELRFAACLDGEKKPTAEQEKVVSICCNRSWSMRQSKSTRQRSWRCAWRDWPT